MANGTTLFFHKCDSYFCALAKDIFPSKELDLVKAWVG